MILNLQLPTVILEIKLNHNNQKTQMSTFALFVCLCVSVCLILFLSHHPDKYYNVAGDQVRTESTAVIDVDLIIKNGTERTVDWSTHMWLSPRKHCVAGWNQKAC